MFSVPGKYSGGQQSSFSWTQTLHEVELRAPVPSADHSVRCAFTARRLDLSWAVAGKQEAEPVAVGELSAVVAASDCLWSVDRDDKTGQAVAVVMLHKSKPEVWSKLFADDPEPAEAPVLLDGVQRTTPQTKQELLAASS